MFSVCLAYVNVIMKLTSLLYLCAAVMFVLPVCKNFDGPIPANSIINIDTESDALPEREMDFPPSPRR